MAIVPKGADSLADEPTATNVRQIRSAGHGGGRKSSRGYDPATGKESVPKGYRDPNPEFDVFALTENNGYSEDRFYCRSIDLKGHGERMQIRVPQGLDSQIYAAIAEIPEYDTKHDLIRDALVHRLEYLQKRYNLSDGARRTLELERFTADSEARAREINELTATVEDINTKLKVAWDAEDWQMFMVEIQGSEERTEWLREPYKGRAENVIQGWKERGKEQLRVARRAKE